ncbi:MAG: beta-mannosidase [Paramuribaculum sp.]|nr:beta-mannosidase [Bacteroides sp.]MBD5374575.1 beta-mannosidase [Bacteroides sp.]MDE7459935.1 beta-mannosidase [Paramuribaculum sp.]
MKNILTVAAAAVVAVSAAVGCSSPAVEQPEFVTVRDGEFYIGDSVYRYVGANFWYGGLLGAEKYGDRERLARELDKMKEIGITNLRVLVGGDGAEGIESHIEPVLQTAPGVYNDTLLEGLDYFLAELEKRDMKAVLYLNNAWEWSGGYGTYLEWTGHGPAPLPKDGYREYVDYVSQFVLSDSAKQLAMNHVRNIVGRTSSVTGKPYSESPAIMSWQIANEPRAFSREGKRALADWLRQTARTIKEIDSNHLVSTGSEGKYGCEVDLDLWAEIHNYPEIDYANIHIWPYNWNWIRKDTKDGVVEDVDSACKYTQAYIDEHFDKMGGVKPIVLEEFGYPRDTMGIAPGSPTTGRDRYYEYVFSIIRDSGKINGSNFWGWGGYANPAHRTWQRGDDYSGDPAQEDQGLNSVFVTDSTTIEVIRRMTDSLKDIKK